MELAFNTFGGRQQRGQTPGGEPASAGLDWFSLQTRFAAAHAARRAMSGFEPAAALPRGDFTYWSRSTASAGQGIPDINPNDLADRKGAAGKVVVVADDAPCSGRGPK